MANDILLREQTATPKQIRFKSASFASPAPDFSDATAGNITDAALTLASLANSNGTTAGGRQSAKVDLGAVFAREYAVRCAFEMAATPTAGNVIEFYWAPSRSSTAGSGNGGNVTGTDAAYSGYSSDLDASLKELQYIGAFVCVARATTTVQAGEVVGTLMPYLRYGSLVVVNRSGAAVHTSDAKCHIVLDPIIDQIQ